MTDDGCQKVELKNKGREKTEKRVFDLYHLTSDLCHPQIT